jgi:hypothetical protein
MKPLTLILLLGSFVLFSCDDATTDSKDNSSAKITEVENRAINGQQWRITNFSQASIDQTDLFKGFIFEFDSNNLLTSTNGSENLSGTWSVKNNGSEDATKSEFENIAFTIGFTNPSLFAGLSGNWKIVSITDSKIELRHANANGLQADVIQFERI